MQLLHLPAETCRVRPGFMIACGAWLVLSEFFAAVDVSSADNRLPLDAAAGTLTVDAESLPNAMQSAASQMRAGNLSQAIGEQQQVLAALLTLRPTQRPGFEAESDRSRTGSGTDSPGNAGRAAPGGSDGAARESPPQSHAGAAAVVDLERRRGLATAVWGHLPDRDREEMQQSYRESFLPGYEDLVEDYYSALAEQQTRPVEAAGEHAP